MHCKQNKENRFQRPWIYQKRPATIAAFSRIQEAIISTEMSPLIFEGFFSTFSLSFFEDFNQVFC